MATLSRDQMDSIRVQLENNLATGSIPKATWNAAVQAVEDWFENSARSEISTTINTATSPTVLTTQQKTAIAKFWLWSKFQRGG